MAQALDYGKIKDSCSNLTNLATNIGSTGDSMNSAISKITDPAWVGKASESYRDKIKTLADHLPEANRQLAESIIFLASCADAYDQLDKDAVKKLKNLIGGQDYIDKYDVSKAPDVDLGSRYGDDEKSKDNDSDKDKDKKPSGTSCGNKGCGGCGNKGCGGCGGSRYTYSVGNGGTSTDGITGTALESAINTTSSLTDLTTTNMTGKEIKIPDNIKQGSYTVTGYDYWINSGKEMVWSAGTNQRKVAEIWKKQGAVFKNGIAVINVDGVDRYLVAVSPKFGKPGDCIDVKLEDGTIIHCIIADSKGSDAKSEWGHVLGDGSINVLEFEVKRETFLQKGNPTTSKWGLPWDSSKKVASIKNIGSIIGAKEVTKTTDPATALANSSSTDAVRSIIVSVAETQLNNTNESEYVKMFNESNGTAWCSEFASWCAKKSGYSDSVFPKFAGANDGAKWFKKHNQFQGRDYKPQAGDVMFTGGSKATHTALVAKVDADGTIHTIEGNIKDKVTRRTHKVGDSNIYGYGTPDYSKLVKSDTNVDNSSTNV